MADITIDKIREGEVETSDPVLNIAMGNQPLAVGQHNFQLTVSDSSGNESAAAIVTVFILDQEAPTAILRALDENGRPATRFSFGQTFTLDASLSTDAGGGQINRYVWRLINADEA